MGGSRPTSSCGGCSSSGEEDGDAEWKAAIQSIVATTSIGFTANGSKNSLSDSSTITKTIRNNPISHSTPVIDDEASDEGEQKHHPQKLKHYQIKAQKLLENMLDKTLVMVKDANNFLDDDIKVNEGGVRLFKNSTPGIVFDYIDEIQRPTKRPKILPGIGIDENSKEFRQKLRSVAVDGKDILAAARQSSQKSLARLEAKHQAAKEKAKREEERIAELKRIRGERWLPSMAREMQMPMVLAMVIDGLRLFVRTLWGLQERRFFITFNAVSSAAVSLTMAIAVCFLSIHAHERPNIGDAFI